MSLDILGKTSIKDDDDEAEEESDVEEEETKAKVGQLMY